MGNPKKRAKMNKQDLHRAQFKADKTMQAHWKVTTGMLVFDGNGKGIHLCTDKDYGNFELLVDWKIPQGGDSGIYLRGSPQVQIWDTNNKNRGADKGSGGLYDNKKHPRADCSISWPRRTRFRLQKPIPHEPEPAT